MGMTHWGEIYLFFLQTLPQIFISQKCLRFMALPETASAKLWAQILEVWGDLRSRFPWTYRG